ncbi:MAG: homocysteine S-methyltransferase family protein [Acidimicrobiia bacterium]|nr:homocysteine S-methyltransferase family protein [Acidimicrobiia bacterium]
MTAMEGLRSKLAAGGLVLIDGGTGTEIEKQGGAMVEGAWCGAAAMTNPAVVQKVHEAYLNVGAEMIIANNFATARHVLAQAGWDHSVEDLNRRGVELALAARTATGRADAVVAGTISPTRQGGPPIPLDVMAANLAEAAAMQADAGAELMILEMMRSIDSTTVAIEAATAVGLPVWLGWSCEAGEHGPVLIDDGGPLAEAMAWVAQQEPVELVAIMHTETDFISACIEVVNQYWDGPTGAYAHTGEWRPPHWIFEETITPEDYTAAVDTWIDQGVQVLGGCCGIGPAHIEHIRDHLNALRGADHV